MSVKVQKLQPRTSPVLVGAEVNSIVESASA
jgi:hypothetical protein